MPKLIKILLLLTLFSRAECQNKEEIPNPSELCSYMNVNNGLVKNDCYSEDFIEYYQQIEGKVEFSDKVDKYIIVSRLPNSYDCVVIGVLCDNYKELLGMSLQYSGKFYEYHGTYNPPIGGQKIYVVKNFNYKLLNR